MSQGSVGTNEKKTNQIWLSVASLFCKVQTEIAESKKILNGPTILLAVCSSRLSIKVLLLCIQSLKLGQAYSRLVSILGTCTSAFP